MPTLALALAVSPLLPWATEAVAAPREVVLSIRSRGAVVAPVTLNGQGPFDVLLDTGCSHSTLSAELAEQFALPVVAKVRVSTLAAAETRLVVELERMAIGGASVEGLTPSLVSRSRLRALQSGIDGVIGQDFLSRFDYTLDYRRKRLRWTAEPDDGPARLPLIRAGDRPLVQLPGDERQGPVLMVPDSGTEGFVVFERRGRTAVMVDYASQLLAVSALDQRRIGRSAVLRELRLGPLVLRDLPAVVLGREGDRAFEGDGLMPLHHFSSVSFNNSEAFMLVRK
jgi:hypothetical protein